MSALVPRWSRHEPVIRRVRERLAVRRAGLEGAALVAAADQAEAAMRDFAALEGLDLDDEDTVYAVLCGVRLVFTQLLASEQAGACTCRDCIVKAIVANLMPFIPTNVGAVS